MNVDETMSLNEPHLTDEQFGALMLSEGLDLGARTHLDHCARCQREVESFTDSVQLAGKTSLAWIDAKPPRRSLEQVSRLWQRRLLYYPAAFALVAMLLIMMGMLIRDHDRTQNDQPAIAQAVSEDSPAQVAEDNHLLESVNLVLSENQGSPLPESRLAEYTRPASRTDSRLK